MIPIDSEQLPKFSPKDNPFNSAAQHSLKFRFPRSYSWEKFLSELTNLNYSGSIVGAKGAGKTVFLEELKDRLINKGFSVKTLFLNRELNSRFKDILAEFYLNLNDDHIILFDGSEQLTHFAWKNFYRKVRGAKGIIITRHTEGNLPALLTFNTSPELLFELIQELLNKNGLQALLDEKDTWGLFANILYEEFNGDLRLAFRRLYELFSK
jgi:hypothetical protein